MFFFISKFSYSQPTPAIISDWMDFAGISDTLTVIPIAQDDSANIISVGVMMNDTTGPDILISKVDSNGAEVFKKTYSSTGFNRDQAIALAVDDNCSIYVAGVVYSNATNFDWIILKYTYDGTLVWTYTLNGTANNYDAPAAIKIKNSFLYVTGEVYDSVTQMNYATIQLNRTTGALNWKRQYDFHSLYDVAFAMDISGAGTGITVAGASQDNLTKWNYCSISYDSAGVAHDTTRIDGTANSFDRPMAVRSDVFGNFYITGAASDSGASFNVRTAKVDSAGNLAWVADFGSNAIDDEGNDIIVDDSGYIYVCGKSNSYTANNQDLVLIKYSNNGTEQYYRMFDADSAGDEARKMCFDNYGNIVMTGTAMRSNKDILTIAYNRIGILLWKIYFNGEFDGDDEGTGITADANGNIFVAGASQITDSTYQKVTIKYKTDYFLVPQDTVPAPASLLFYVNQGQIIDTQDSVRTDGMFYYTINQYPKLYFHTDSVSFVMAHVDVDTATTDTLERIAMNFADGVMDKPYSDRTHDTDQVLNYFLGHCPDGITGITGSEKLMYPSVYDFVDVIFANNNAGMKFQIVINPGANPDEIRLHFKGHQSLQLISNSDLNVSGILGSFTYERPLAYQLDSSGNKIALGWLASYNIVDSADVMFSFGGSYNPALPLVLECAREVTQYSTQTTIGNLVWSTYFGATFQDWINDCVTDNSGNLYVAGQEYGTNFPVTTGAFQFFHSGSFDGFVSKFIPVGNINTHTNLYWSTYYGGGDNDYFNGIALDKSTGGDLYLTGQTESFGTTPFPTLTSAVAVNNPWNQNLNGQTGNWSYDAFVVRLTTANGLPVWSTYFGGEGNEEGFDIQVNQSTQDVYLVGRVDEYGIGTYILPLYTSPNTNSYNQTVAGGATQPDPPRDAFVARFDHNDNLLWCSYFGGDEMDFFNSVAVLYDNSVVITGTTKSANANNPTATAPCPANNTGEFQDCDPGITGSYYDGTYNGGVQDAILVCFNDQDQLMWSTYFGGPDDDNFSLNSIAAPPSTPVKFYVAGTTGSSTGFPLYPSSPPSGYMQDSYGGGKNDMFYANFVGFSQVWCTYLGGYSNLFPVDDNDFNPCITIDGATNAYVFGNTRSEFTQIACTASTTGLVPICTPSNYFSQSSLGYRQNCFIARFDPNNNLTWSTYIGGDCTNSTAPCNGFETAHAACFDGNYLFVVGCGDHPNNPTALAYPYPLVPYTDYYQQTDLTGVSLYPWLDGFISKFDVSTLIGIPENKKASLGLLFKNPVSANLHLFINSNELFGLPVSINIYDATGRIVLQKRLGKLSGEFSDNIFVGNLCSGFYTATVMIGTTVLTNKLIKL